MAADRRSRMRRTPTGKRIAITARDIELFRALARYRFLRSTYLHAFVGGASETRFKERLGDHFHEGFLDRPAEQWKFATCRYHPVVYELGKGGRAVLAELGDDIIDQPTWLSPGPQRQFEHSLMICGILASVELGIRQRPDLRFIAWPEIRAKAPDYAQCKNSTLGPTISAGNSAGERMPDTLIPDALFGIQYTVNDRRLYRFFAVEADRGTMPIVRKDAKQTSILRKTALYREAAAQNRCKTDLGVPNLLVLIVTPSQQRAENILRNLDGQTAAGPAILVRSVELGAMVRPFSAMIAKPWAMAGGKHLCIVDPS